jgi:hypothetical protein
LRDLVDPRVAAALAHEGINGWDGLWSLDYPWVQSPNRRRGGFQGVVRRELTLPDGGSLVVYLKVHRNRVSRTPAHPFKGIPTLRREVEALKRLDGLGIPVTKPVYYAERTVGGERRAMMMTEELAGFESLEDRVTRWCEEGWPPPSERADLIRSLARILDTVHARVLKMNAYTEEHIFVKGSGAGTEICLIDCERCKRVWSGAYARVGDLATFDRTTMRWSRTDRWRFLKAYLGNPATSAGIKGLWNKVLARRRRKAKSRPKQQVD